MIKTENMNEVAKLKKQLRTAVANYIASEGCNCCRGDSHEEHLEVIAKILNVKKYADKSGYDFSKYKTQ